MAESKKPKGFPTVFSGSITADELLQWARKEQRKFNEANPKKKAAEEQNAPQKEEE